MIYNQNVQPPFMPAIPLMPAQPILARAYVPYQINFAIYGLEEGYNKGTLFPDLYRPYPGIFPSGRDR